MDIGRWTHQDLCYMYTITVQEPHMRGAIVAAFGTLFIYIQSSKISICIGLHNYQNWWSNYLMPFVFLFIMITNFDADPYLDDAYHHPLHFPSSSKARSQKESKSALNLFTSIR